MAEAFKARTWFCSSGATLIRWYYCSGLSAMPTTVQATSTTPVPSMTVEETDPIAESKKKESKEIATTMRIGIALAQ